MSVGIIEESLGTSDSLTTSPDVWARFVSSSGGKDFPQLWLALLCARIPQARAAMVLLGSVDRGPFTPAGVWPSAGRDLSFLSPSAEVSLRERRGLAQQRQASSEAGDPGGYDLTYPLLIGEKLYGVLVIDLPDLDAQALQQARRQVHWGVPSLLMELLKRERSLGEQAQQRILVLLDLVTIVVEEARFQGAAAALVSELANRLDCDRVSLGQRKGGQIRVEAVSHSATFGRQMNLTRLTGAAMDEAIDQEARIWWPDDEGNLITRAHQELAEQQAAPEICTLPIRVAGEWEFALTIEMPEGRRLTELDADFCETVGEIVAPMLLCKREQERWLIGKAGVAMREQLKRLFGARYLGRKLIASSLLLLILFFAFATGQYRVGADAAIEGEKLRALAAPFDGYIDTANARAGEEVRQGDLLMTLDDRDLKLEQVQIATEQAQYRRERRQAQAEHDRAAVRILTAQLQQSEAQQRLIEERLSRTRLMAPFDGILVSGDLSQSLGAPVQRGDVLFELAPLGTYRVKLAVGERDIDDVALGQKGTLVLAALPNLQLPIEVTLITPVTSVEDGNNTFAVEASLAEVPPTLRPGMHGVAKVEVGERRLIWIWTRDFIRWARLTLWAWFA